MTMTVQQLAATLLDPGIRGEDFVMAVTRGRILVGREGQIVAEIDCYGGTLSKLCETGETAV